MQLNEIKSDSSKRKTRVGRGGKKGTTSGKGTKGQKSRSGRKMRPEWRDALKKIPKKRGYKFKASPKAAILNLRDLDINFKENEIVSPQVLLEKGLVGRIKGKVPEIKILGDGELKKNLVFENISFSQSAKEKVEKAGGSIKQRPATSG